MPPEKPKDWDLIKKQSPNDDTKPGALATVNIKEDNPEDNRRSLSKMLSSSLKAVGGGQQAKLEQLESEIRVLRRENERLKKGKRDLKGGASINKSLIESYSEILDELSGYDSAYKVQDHLPKVVVVGDQSSGKTSVLEMIAGARIFPRGAGKMMTRAPVQVTLSEGPYHIARFKDSGREFDLTKESEQAELRNEIENRMRISVQDGKTVSNQVISLSIQGPGIQRMVLVDLPGIISTVTNKLAPGTRECIEEMVTDYMKNPNAIILCIQDGSIDAERSIFTNLIREVDEKGRRTIVVVTKVDVAEKAHDDPSEIKEILDGQIFPMKALGYYAVIAGKGREDDNIQDIKDYEEQFFRTSSLCEKGILNRNQCTTKNLSAKVSECFWGMVKDSVAQQADVYRAKSINLDEIWKKTFPDLPQMTRDELFHNARNKILRKVEELSKIPTLQFDQFIYSQLLDNVKGHLSKRIYSLNSESPPHSLSPGEVEIELQRWVESHELPKLSIQVAQESLRRQFDNLFELKSPSGSANKKRKDSTSDDFDDGVVFQALGRAVIKDALMRHQWNNQALSSLRLVQLEALDKGLTPTNREDWNKAILLLQDCLKDEIVSTSQELSSLTGYSFTQRWLKWKYNTPDQNVNRTIKQELDNLLMSTHETSSNASLSEHELTAIKRNLKSQGVEVSDSAIQRLWKPYLKYDFLTKEVDQAQYCSKLFNFYERGIDSGTDCSHVLFFWRIKRMLESTAINLRRQLLLHEFRGIKDEIVEVLEEYGENDLKKAELLSCKRIELAEELKKVRQIQQKLEEFIKALNKDGKV